MTQDIGYYEPKNEEEVLFPKYLAPEESVTIERRGVIIWNRSLGSNFNGFEKSKKSVKKIKQFLNSKIYMAIFYFSLLSVSFLYALETPTMEPNHIIKVITFYADWVIWGIFFIDWLFKAYIYLLQGKCKIFHLVSFLFDLAVLTMSIFYLLGNSDLAFARILRIFKVLIVIKKIKILNSVAQALIKSVKQIASVGIFLTSIYFVFAILFVRYYSGNHDYCNTTNIPNDLEDLKATGLTSLNRRSCIDYGGDWVYRPLNFNTISSSWKSVFVLSTGEAWVDIMWNSFASTHTNNAYFDENIVDDFKLSGLLFVFTLIIFNFFLIDLFTGVIVDAFYNQKQKTTGLSYLTKIQKDWVYLMYFILEFKPLVIVQHGMGNFQKFFLQFDKNFWKEVVLCIYYLLLLIVWCFRRFGNSERDRRVTNFIEITYFFFNL